MGHRIENAGSEMPLHNLHIPAQWQAAGRPLGGEMPPGGQIRPCWRHLHSSAGGWDTTALAGAPPQIARSAPVLVPYVSWSRTYHGPVHIIGPHLVPHLVPHRTSRSLGHLLSHAAAHGSTVDVLVPQLVPRSHAVPCGPTRSHARPVFLRAAPTTQRAHRAELARCTHPLAYSCS